MLNLNFHYIFILTITISEYNLISSERRLTQEEWHQMRFGSDATQWTLSNPTEAQSDSESGQNTSDANDASVETDLQTVDVGKDKLVLVNDEGTIKMLRASQLPIAPKPNGDTSVPTAPFNSYFEAKGTNNNPATNPIDYITPNYGAGHKVAGIPVTFASGSKTDRPNVIYQKFDDRPCRVATNSPPYYIPAPQLTLSNASSKSGKMVRIIIEMPESMTKNIDEASRFAASQVKKLKLPLRPDMNEETDTQRISGNPQTRRKKAKNVQEIIRKVVHLEEDDEDAEEHNDNARDDSGSNHEEVTAEKSPDHSFVDDKDSNSRDNSRDLVLRRNGGRSKRNRRLGNLRELNKYKKVIKIYRN